MSERYDEWPYAPGGGRVITLDTQERRALARVAVEIAVRLPVLGPVFRTVQSLARDAEAERIRGVLDGVAERSGPHRRARSALDELRRRMV